MYKKIEITKMRIFLNSYSGADIQKVINDALMQSNRKIQSATHFKRVTGSSPTNPYVMVHDMYTPCSHEDSDAIAMSWMDIASEKLLEPKITKVFFSFINFYLN